jgi:trk system potassium uptake protein TrkA
MTEVRAARYWAAVAAARTGSTAVVARSQLTVCSHDHRDHHSFSRRRQKQCLPGRSGSELSRPLPACSIDVVHIVVVGCGRVGSKLAFALVNEGHSVAIIDKNPDAFRRLVPKSQATELVGFGFDRDILIEAGAGEADALAAVTSGDNSNILTARIARETYQIPAVVARIYDPRRAEIYQRLGIVTVATVSWTIDQVMRGLFPSRSGPDWIDPTGRIELVERLLPARWAGRAITSLEDETGAKVVAVTRCGVPQLGAGNLIGQTGDLLHLVVEKTGEQTLHRVLGDASSVEKVER